MESFWAYWILGIPMMILSGIAVVIAGFSVPVALVIDFIGMLIGGWLIFAFTIAYIQLTPEEQNKEIIAE